MTEPMFPHGVTCGRCGKRLLPGGAADQQVYEIEHERKNPWEGDRPSPRIVELVCKACKDAALSLTGWKP